MQESFALEHRRELLGHTLEQFLDGGGVANESDSHFETTRRNIALGGEDVVGDPFHKVSRVFALYVLHLLLDFLHRDLSTEDGSNGKVAPMTRVRSRHHVLSIEHLRSELGYGDSAVLLITTSGQGSEPDHEEVETRERNKVDRHFAQIRVELTGELHNNQYEKNAVEAPILPSNKL